MIAKDEGEPLRKSLQIGAARIPRRGEKIASAEKIEDSVRR
jgi:hypothetical protein